jgi:hypothetical protein
MRRGLDPANYPDVRPWVIRAIAEERQCSPDLLWRNERTVEQAEQERRQRVKFLRKHEKTNLAAKAVADRLNKCKATNRCCSGACPECGRLF